MDRWFLISASFTFASIVGGVVAQTGADPVSGGAGWVGAGLLGLVLGWLLLIHLPAKDKQIKELIDTRDALYRDVTARFETNISNVIQHCREEAERSSRVASQQYTDQQDLLRRIHDSTRETVHALRNMHAAFSSRTQLADAFHSAAVAAWTKRTDGTVTAWNGAAELLLGWRQGEIIGRSAFRTIIPPEIHERERDMLRRVSAGETIEEHASVRLTNRGERVDIMMTLSPIRDVSGQIAGASVIARSKDRD